MNVTRVLKNTAIAAVTVLPLCCVYQNNKIRNEILHDQQDSIFWADIQKNKYAESIPTQPFSTDYILDYFAYNNKWETPIGDEVRKLKYNTFLPEGIHLPSYWKKLKQGFDEVREKRRNIASEYVKDCEHRENMVNAFLDSDEFKSFIQNQKKSKEEFLKKHKNHKWVHSIELNFNRLPKEESLPKLTVKYLINRIDGTNRWNNGYPYQVMELLGITKKNIKRDNGKGYSWVTIYEPNKRTISPFINIMTFYRLRETNEGKVLRCDYYAEDKPQPDKLNN